MLKQKLPNMSSKKSNVLIRTMKKYDIPKIVELQKASFPLMAAEGVYWKPNQLESHLKVFPKGQFVAEYRDKIIGSCSSLIVKLEPEYKEHSWKEVCGDSFLKIIILKVIPFMVLMFQHIQIIVDWV